MNFQYTNIRLVDAIDATVKKVESEADSLLAMVADSGLEFPVNDPRKAVNLCYYGSSVIEDEIRAQYADYADKHLAKLIIDSRLAEIPTDIKGAAASLSALVQSASARENREDSQAVFNLKPSDLSLIKGHIRISKDKIEAIKQQAVTTLTDEEQQVFSFWCNSIARMREFHGQGFDLMAILECYVGNPFSYPSGDFDQVELAKKVRSMRFVTLHQRQAITSAINRHDAEVRAEYDRTHGLA